MSDRILRYIANLRANPRDNNTPIPLIRQYAFDSKYQLQYDWNGTLNSYIELSKSINEYSNNLNKFVSNDLYTQNIFIKRVNTSNVNLKNMLMYFYINPPAIIRNNSQMTMPDNIAYKITEIILAGEDFINIYKNYDNNTITKYTLLKRQLFSTASWCPGATVLVISIFALVAGIFRNVIS
jgi:hypothetical protein